MRRAKYSSHQRGPEASLQSSLSEDAGLHRLEREIPDSDIAKIAQDIYSTLEWIDDYAQAQMERTVRLSGKTYRRIRYGKEPLWKGPTKEDAALWKRQAEPPCHDCGVIEGELHLDGRDWERCPRCKGQNLGCPCRTEEDHEWDLKRTRSLQKGHLLIDLYFTTRGTLLFSNDPRMSVVFL